MKYVFLVYQEEALVDVLGECRQHAIAGEACDYREQLRQSGHLLASPALQPIQSATTVRVRFGEAAIADGSVAETKDELRQVWLIEARDLNEAIRLAARMPEARLGSIEVRPLKQGESER